MESNAHALKIVVADTSAIIRSGLCAVLKRLPNLNILPVEVATPDALHHYMLLHHPDVVFVNPAFGGSFCLTALKAEQHEHLMQRELHGLQGPTPNVRFVALLSAMTDHNVLKDYDDQCSIYEEPAHIAAKISALCCPETEDDDAPAADDADALSQRERQIIACIVKGMTNKAIAQQLFLSVHTVVTHRRNIARKLQIHSTAGLTIYAIVNKLVSLQDIKDQL